MRKPTPSSPLWKIVYDDVRRTGSNLRVERVGDDLWIRDLEVGAGGRGDGSRILREVEEAARADGVARIRIWSAAAADWWERRGFRYDFPDAVYSDDADDDDDMWFMSKIIGPKVGRASGRAGGQQAWDRGFYMEGACDVFALALASLSGLPLGALTDDKGFLRHVVVVIDRGHYADALGIHAGEVDEPLTPRAVKGLFSTCGMSEAQIQKHVAAAKRRILNDPELSSLISGRTRARAPRARGVW